MAKIIDQLSIGRANFKQYFYIKHFIIKWV